MLTNTFCIEKQKAVILHDKSQLGKPLFGYRGLDELECLPRNLQQPLICLPDRDLILSDIVSEDLYDFF